MTRWNQLLELTRTRLLLQVRQPEALLWTFLFPVILAAVLGFAFRSSGPAPGKVGIVAGPGAEELRAALAGTEHLDVELIDAEHGRQKLRRAALDVLVVPADASAAGSGAMVDMILDPQRDEAQTARLRVLVALGQPPPDMRTVPMTELGARYVDYLLPGLLGANLMGTSLWMIGFAVADLRQKKLLKRLLITPMSRSTFLLSFMVARLAFFAAEVAALVLFGVLALDVPFRANVLSFGLLGLLGAASFAGIGLIAAARSSTAQGASGFIYLVGMPMWLLSGMFFSYERYPEVLHPILRALPLTALNDGLRALMLEGASLLSIGAELAILAAWGVISFVVAMRVFRWS